MQLKEAAPFVRNALNNSLGAHTKNDIYAPLRARDCRLFLFHTGAGSIVIDHKEYEIQPQCLIFIPAGTEYIWQPQDTIHFLAVNFDFTDNFSHITQSFHPQKTPEFSGILEKIAFTDAVCFSQPIILPHAGFLENRIRELVFTFCTNSVYRKESLSALMKSILISIADALCAPKAITKNSSLIYALIQYLQDHYRENITAAALMQRFHFSMTYINRIFKEKTGDSVHQFLIKYRIRIASELLSSGMYTAAQVAEAVGFCDVYHFAKTFKKITGKTPAHYRKENQ